MTFSRIHTRASAGQRPLCRKRCSFEQKLLLSITSLGLGYIIFGICTIPNYFIKERLQYVNKADLLSFAAPNATLERSTLRAIVKKQNEPPSIYTPEALRKNPYLGWQPPYIKAPESFTWMSCFTGTIEYTGEGLNEDGSKQPLGCLQRPSLLGNIAFHF